MIKDNDKDIPKIENTTQNLLNNEQYYFSFILETIQQIIKDYGLKYSGIVDSRKEHPDFTYNQFLFLLAEIKTRVYDTDLELLHDNYINKYNPNYSIPKVEKAYNIYNKLCKYYGFNCTESPFLDMIGLDDMTIKNWLNSGRSDLLKRLKENATKGVLSQFENSQVPLLQLAVANHKRGLSQTLTEHDEHNTIKQLPDLLGLSQDKKPLLTDSQ